MADRVVVERYRHAGFGGSVPRGVRPAVLVVDFTVGFTDPGRPTGADMTAAVEFTGEVLGGARVAGVPVVFTTIAYDHPGEGGMWLAKAPGMAGLRTGTRLVEIDERLPRRPEDVVVIKKGPSAFFGTHLASLLVSWQVDTLVVCGATTSGCVRATVVDALSYGWAPLVPRECVADRAAGPHDAALFDMEQKYADVIDAREAIDYLGGTANSGRRESRRG
ncbi:isochorismatase family protein [Spirillospora sp. NBC_00431]